MGLMTRFHYCLTFTVLRLWCALSDERMGIVLVKSKSHCDCRSVSQSVSQSWCRGMTRYLLLFDSYGLVFLRRPLWREDGSVFHIWNWSLPAQSFSGPSPYFTVSDLRLPFSTPPTTRRVTVEVTVLSNKGMVRSDRSKPALIFFSLQEYTQQNPLSIF
jgi:hypothetical protein